MPTDEGAPPLRVQLREAYEYNTRSVASPGFAAVALNHLAWWAKRRPFPLNVPLRVLARMAFVFVRNVYGIELPNHVKVGRRFHIAHQGGIVIHPNTVFGDDCVVRQNVTIGAAGGRPWAEDHPTFGNRVKIGAGAVVIGAIHVGDDVRIGPNAVVTTSVPAGSMVVSPLSRRLRRPDFPPGADGAAPAAPADADVEG
jgi:serine O-acetyltransferase